MAFAQANATPRKPNQTIASKVIASLPMYDWPELRTAHDELWRLLQKRFLESGISAPNQLTRDDSEDCFWRSPDLLFGQTCGYPFATSLKDEVQYVATPHYTVAGCERAQYSSFLVAQKSNPVSMNQLAKLRFAYNGSNSLSGYRTVYHSIGEPKAIFHSSIKSGSHRQSARMVADNLADVAALDAVCWHWLQEFEPQTAKQLYVVEQTTMLPALPFIASLKVSKTDITQMQRILDDELTRKLSGAKLSINGCSILPLSDYQLLGSY